MGEKKLGIPSDLQENLAAAGQEHVVADWNQLSADQREQLLRQLQAIDLPALQELYESRDQRIALPARHEIEPVPVHRVGEASPSIRELGEKAIAAGQVAALVVAGGQGSRLGFHHPKGMFPIGPVSGKSLFQIHAEKVLALSRRHHVAIPMVILTSAATHSETKEFFSAHGYFGMPVSDVFMFQQGTMPAVDIETGKLLLQGPGRIFTSPNGHGGTLPALSDSGLLGELEKRGVKHWFYFQVDNPLVKIADPEFLGIHLQAGAEASSKIVPREDPSEKLGSLVCVRGRCTMIEYSDLPPDLAAERDDKGRLKIWAGSPAIHWFSTSFLKRVAALEQGLPFHIARKKVPFFEGGRPHNPKGENALKFEMFIFDILPIAERWTVVETSRAEEFVPLKNASGPDSPETVRGAITSLVAAWLEHAGVTVPRNRQGTPLWPLEISPLYALDAPELEERLQVDFRLTGPTYLV